MAEDRQFKKKPSNRDISATAKRAIDCDEIWHNDASPLELTLVKISNSLEIQDDRSPYSKVRQC